MAFDKKLIPNYIFAGMFFAVFLWACTFALTNWESLGASVSGMTPGEALVIGGVGGALITALIVNVKDMVAYFYRKNPSPTT